MGYAFYPAFVRTYRHTADIRMPDLGVKLHDGRLERVHVWDDNIDLEGSPGIGRVGRPWKGALEVRQVGGVDRVREHA